MNSGRFYCLWTSNFFLCHREYIINAPEFHYNTFDKTQVFNQFHVYGSSIDFYTNLFKIREIRMYLRERHFRKELQMLRSHVLKTLVICHHIWSICSLNKFSNWNKCAFLLNKLPSEFIWVWFSEICNQQNETSLFTSLKIRSSFSVSRSRHVR